MDIMNNISVIKTTDDCPFARVNLMDMENYIEHIYPHMFLIMFLSFQNLRTGALGGMNYRSYQVGCDFEGTLILYLFK